MIFPLCFEWVNEKKEEEKASERVSNNVYTEARTQRKEDNETNLEKKKRFDREIRTLYNHYVREISTTAGAAAAAVRQQQATFPV